MKNALLILLFLGTLCGGCTPGDKTSHDFGDNYDECVLIHVSKSQMGREGLAVLKVVNTIEASCQARFPLEEAVSPQEAEHPFKKVADCTVTRMQSCPPRLENATCFFCAEFPQEKMLVPAGQGNYTEIGERLSIHWATDGSCLVHRDSVSYSGIRAWQRLVGGPNLLRVCPRRSTAEGDPILRDLAPSAAAPEAAPDDGLSARGGELSEPPTPAGDH